MKKVSNYIYVVAAALAIVFFVVMTVAACLQVITRYVFSYSFSWTEELCRFTFIWLNMIGGYICYRQGGHAVVDFHIKALPKKVSNTIFLVGDILIFACGILMITQGWKVTTITARQPSPAMHLPMSYVYSSVVVSGVLICIQAVEFVITRIGAFNQPSKTGGK